MPVRTSTILIFRIWIRWIFFCRRQEIDNSEEFVRRLRSFRLKRFEFYANFAKLKRRLRSFHLKCFEVYTKFAKLNSNECEIRDCEAFVSNAPRSTVCRLCEAKEEVAKLSTQTLRGLRELCEALNSNECEIRGCEAFVSNAPRRTLTLRSSQL